MLIKKIKFEKPLTGETAERTFYFTLSESELMDMELLTPTGLGSFLTEIVESKDNVNVLQQFKNIIRVAYCEIGDDGEHILKQDEKGNPLWRKFEQHPAYNKLYMELFTDPEKCKEFITGIMPKDIQNNKDFRAQIAAVDVK